MNRMRLMCLIALGGAAPSAASENGSDDKAFPTHSTQQSVFSLTTPSNPDPLIQEAYTLMNCVYDFSCMVSAIHEGNLLIKQALNEAKNNKS